MEVTRSFQHGWTHYCTHQLNIQFILLLHDAQDSVTLSVEDICGSHHMQKKPYVTSMMLLKNDCTYVTSSQWLVM